MSVSSTARIGLLRDRRDGRAVPVTNMELFFDLVYVFAFTQLSALLYERLSWGEALRAGICHYNTLDDVDRLTAAFADLVKSEGTR